MQSFFERAGVQSFWEAFKRIEGVLNKTEERLAKLGGGLVIFLLKGSEIILTLPDVIAHTSFKCSVIMNCSPLHQFCAYGYCRADVFH